jgi:GTP-binding protein
VLKVREAVAVFGGNIRVEAFSSLKGTGVDRAREVLTEWLLQDNAAEEQEATA